MVIDRAGILDDGQETSAINDAWRLNLIGIPAQVVTEYAQFTQPQADARARELRIANGIASARNADDGLLVYAAVDPANRRNIVIAVSAGAHALPRNGLTEAAIADLANTIIAVQLEDGHPARAIVYSLREFIYLEQYVPPAATPLTGWRDALHQAAPVLVPVVLLATVTWIVTGRRRRNPVPIWRELIVLSAVGGAIATIGVLSRNSFAVFTALAIGAWVLARLIQLDGRSWSPSRRTIAATPRPPRTMHHGSRTIRP
jgi:hypothetical protein